MLRGINIGLALAVAALALVLTRGNPAEGQSVPQPPHFFSGSVTVGGAPATNGLTIEALIGGTNFARSISGTTTTAGGKYGDSPASDFRVSADNADTPGKEGGVAGDAITFRVGGFAAVITVVNPGSACAGFPVPAAGSQPASFPFCNGSTSVLDLTVAAIPTPTPTPAGAPAPGPGPAPAGQFALSGLSASPSSVAPGTTVTISFTASHTSGGAINTSVEVFINGESAGTFPVVLAVGGSATFSFTTSRTAPGVYLVLAGTLSTTFTVLAPTPTPTPPPIPVSAPVVSTISTTVQISQQQATLLQDALTQALGTTAVIQTTTATVQQITTTDAQGQTVTALGAQLAVTGVTAGQQIQGQVNATLGNLTIQTNNGVGTGVLNLGGGLSVVGGVRLVPGNGTLDIVFQNPVLRFEPPPPSASQLTGGSALVTNIGARFDVGLQNLPQGAQLQVQYAKQADTFIQNLGQTPGAVFSLVAQQIGGAGATIANPTEDVAFAVQVTRTGITNQDLGTNAMSLQVSRAWFDARTAQGKAIAITKVDDAGNVFSQPAVCTPLDATTMNCAVTFSGAAGGFSIFALLSVAQAPGVTVTPPPTHTPTPTLVPPIVTPTPTRTPTPTSTPVPTPTPTLTPTPVLPTATPTPVVAPTPTPTPAAGGGLPGFIWVIIWVIVAVVIVGGVAAFLLTRRR